MRAVNPNSSKQIFSLYYSSTPAQESDSGLVENAYTAGQSTPFYTHCRKHRQGQMLSRAQIVSGLQWSSAPLSLGSKWSREPNGAHAIGVPSSDGAYAKPALGPKWSLREIGPKDKLIPGSHAWGQIPHRKLKLLPSRTEPVPF